METITINKKDLEYHSRIDADFYKNEYCAIVNHLKKIKDINTMQLRSILLDDARTGSTPSPLDRIPLNDGTDVLFIKTDSVREGYIKYNVVDLLPISEHKKRKITALQYGDVIVTVVGATHDIVGRAAVYLLDVPANINQSDVLLRINTKLMLPGFISTFLNTKYGRLQIWKYSGQTEQVTLNAREVEQVIVPILSMKIQKSIHDDVLKSEELRIQSKKLYEKAKHMFMKEMRLLDFEFNTQRCFVVNSRRVADVKKFEPEYFNPVVDSLVKKITKLTRCDTAGNMFSYTKGKDVESESYIDSGYGFIRVSDITKFGIKEPRKRINKSLFNELQKYTLKKDRILFTKDGTVGISYVVKESQDCVPSGAFLSLKLKNKYSEIDNEYIALVLNSNVIKIQIDGFTGKSSILKHLRPKDFKKLIIPILSIKIQKKLSTMLDDSFKMKKEADGLLIETKSKLEKIITNRCTGNLAL